MRLQTKPTSCALHAAYYILSIVYDYYDARFIRKISPRQQILIFVFINWLKILKFWLQKGIDRLMLIATVITQVNHHYIQTIYKFPGIAETRTKVNGAQSN